MGEEEHRAEDGTQKRETLTPVRCPGCGAMLAERATCGALYVRPTRKRSTWIRSGEVRCIPCDLVITVEAARFTSAAER